MSTIKVNKIENTGTTDGGVEIDSSGHVQVDGVQMPTTGPFNNRRININGAMQVAQRGTVANAGNEYGGPDRYKFAKNDGAYTISQDGDAPSGSGFASSFKIDVTSAASSTGNQYVILQHKMEGQDLQQLKKGTSSAESLTLQFWIKSTKTGTYVVELLHADSTRHVCKTYTVSSSNTWEYKTITFPADTSGTLANNNAASLQLNWWLYAGSTYTSGTLPTSWATFADANSAVGQVNAADSDTNNILFTGIQLEVGEKATPFEHRSYNDELAKCQRYYCHYGSPFTSINSGDRVGQGYVTAPTQAKMILPTGPGKMRANPTPDSTDAVMNDAATNETFSSFADVTAYNGHVCLAINTSSGLTEGRGSNIRFTSTNGYISLDAEL